MMKRVLFSLLILTATINLSAQVSFKTGDVELETDLNTINARAKADFGKFKVEMAGTYNINEKKIEHMHVDLAMEPGDIYMALEIGKVSHKPIDDVLTVYQQHKSKGWGFIAKQLGIKPGSDEFHSLKNNTHQQSASSKDLPGKNKTHKKGKGKKKK